MKALFTLMVVILLSPIAYSFNIASSQASHDKTEEYNRVIENVVAGSGLEEVMLEDEQPNDLKRLKTALLKGMKRDADVRGFMYEIQNIILPEINRLDNEFEQITLKLQLQYNILIMAGQNGYEPQEN